MTLVITEVTEGSSLYLSFNPKDENGVPAAPLTLKYQVNDEDSGAELLAETSIVPPQTVNPIVLAPAVNVLYDGDKELEMHVVTIKTTYGDGSEALNEEWVYGVRKVRFA